MNKLWQQYQNITGNELEINLFFSQLCQQIITPFSRKQEIDLTAIDLLTRVGLEGKMGDQQAALQALYGQLILPLCDDFSTPASQLVDKILAHITNFFRHHPLGKLTDTLLRSYDLATIPDLLARQRQTRRIRAIPAPEQIKKAIILSRITIGADVTLVSPIIQRLQHTMPQATLILAGPKHLAQIFHDQGVIGPCEYARYSPLAQRLAYWPTLLRHIQQQTAGLDSNQFIILDPDSRLSQLGLLPLGPANSTYTLHSRLDQTQPRRLTDICNDWLNQLLPHSPTFAPRFWIAPTQIAQAHSFYKQFNHNTFKIVINFGVGGDDHKRLGDEFEQQLVHQLLALENTLVLLDSGVTPAEDAKANRLRLALADTWPTAKGQEADLTTIPIQRGLLQYRGPIGSLAALIQEADLFIGYDSCCQHLATATKTPAIICFAGAANNRFFARWQPLNQHGATHTIFIDEHLRQQPQQIIITILEIIAAQRHENSKTQHTAPRGQS